MATTWIRHPNTLTSCTCTHVSPQSPPPGVAGRPQLLFGREAVQGSILHLLAGEVNLWQGALTSSIWSFGQTNKHYIAPHFQYMVSWPNKQTNKHKIAPHIQCLVIWPNKKTIYCPSLTVHGQLAKQTNKHKIAPHIQNLVIWPNLVVCQFCLYWIGGLPDLGQ